MIKYYLKIQIQHDNLLINVQFLLILITEVLVFQQVFIFSFHHISGNINYIFILCKLNILKYVHL